MSVTRQRAQLRFGSSASVQTSARAPTADDVRSGRVTLRFGHQGEAVRRVQVLLGVKGATAYEAATLAAVKRFQQEHRLPKTDGLVDGATFTALEQHAPAAAVELTPLAQRVREILESRGISTTEKIAQIWRAFTEGVTSEYGTAIHGSRGIRIERNSAESWVVLLLRHAYSSASNRAGTPFTELVKAVILHDASSCQLAYSYLPAEARRALLDEAGYENALFRAAEAQGTTDDSLSFLKELIKLRFAHITEIESLSESGSPPWEARTLRRIYELMKALPAHQLTQVKKLYRAARKSSAQSEEGIVAGEFDPRTGGLNVRTAPGNDRLSDSGLNRINLFDYSIRHEIGHAVDCALLVHHRQTLPAQDPLKSNHLTYYSQVPGFSEPNWRWVYYDNHRHLPEHAPTGANGFLEMIREMMANAESPHNRPPEGLPFEDFAHLVHLKSNRDAVTNQVDANGRIQSTSTLGREYDPVLRELATRLGLERRALQRRVEDHRVYKALTDTTALEKPFTDGSLSDKTRFGDRVFVKGYSDEFASFSAAAFPRCVRRYGTRSPAEWFAEAYALYHDPAGRAVLERKDPNAVRYLEGLLRRLEQR